MRNSIDLDIHKIKNSKVFLLEKTMMEWGERYYPSARYNSLEKKDIKDFLFYYTGNADRIINGALRDSQNIDKLFSYELFTKETYIRVLEEIENASVPEDIIVYRKIGRYLFDNMLEWSKVNHIRKGSIIFDKGFLSTSLSYRVARDIKHLGKDIMATIYVPKGTKGIYLGNLTNLKEYEMLFLPETKLKVLSFSRVFHRIVCMVINPVIE